MIAAPTGSGKTTATAKAVAEHGSTCWLADRRDDVEAAANAIEGFGGSVGRVLPLDGVSQSASGPIPNCLFSETINQWQEKGYNYRVGFCRLQECCPRRADPTLCPFLASLDALRHADTIAVTKALARRPGFFSASGNPRRQTIVLDEDPIGLLRQPVEITRAELEAFIRLMKIEAEEFRTRARDDFLGRSATWAAAHREASEALDIAQWCWDAIARQPADGQPEAVEIPQRLRPSKPVLKRSKDAQEKGRKEVWAAFHQRMRADPRSTVRNVYRDLLDLAGRAKGRIAFATSKSVLFHLAVKIPRGKRVVVLDATANAELLRPVFAPREVRVLGDERVRSLGRAVQFMDANNPRSTLAKALGGAGAEPPKPSPKVVRIIDELGDRHGSGTIILISYMSHLQKLREMSRHADRIVTAHFGALRGRNDLEGADCYIVVGSPKTTESDRQQLALAVYGRAVLPFPDLATVRRTIVGRVPIELSDGPEERIWEVVCKGYSDPRMQAVYDHTVVAELTHAADRARVLINPATVYLLTNEPCPALWFAELCLADELLDLSPGPRSDFRSAYTTFSAKAQELLNAGRSICGADVCRALGKDEKWGKRYWVQFVNDFGDALQGMRNRRWKESQCHEDDG